MSFVLILLYFTVAVMTFGLILALWYYWSMKRKGIQKSSQGTSPTQESAMVTQTRDHRSNSFISLNAETGTESFKCRNCEQELHNCTCGV